MGVLSRAVCRARLLRVQQCRPCVLDDCTLPAYCHHTVTHSVALVGNAEVGLAQTSLEVPLHTNTLGAMQRRCQAAGMRTCGLQLTCKRPVSCTQSSCKILHRCGCCCHSRMQRAVQ